MQELSMNVLDVAENSVAAGATLVAITLSIDTAAKRMTLTITDNGKGMPPEMAARVTDPFCTTRKTRKVGLGLPFLKMAAEMTGGALSIESTVGKGTCVTAWFSTGPHRPCCRWAIWPPPWRRSSSAARTSILCTPCTAGRRAVRRGHARAACGAGRRAPESEPSVALWLQGISLPRTPNNCLQKE